MHLCCGFIIFRLHKSGLQDGIFSNPKSQFGQILEGLLTGKCWWILWPLGIYFGTLVDFMGIWQFSCNLVDFSPFWYILSR
jgi:hypothetical protein